MLWNLQEAIEKYHTLNRVNTETILNNSSNQQQLDSALKENNIIRLTPDQRLSESIDIWDNYASSLSCQYKRVSKASIYSNEDMASFLFFLK